MAMDKKITGEAYGSFEAFSSSYITDSNQSPRITRARSLNNDNGAMLLSNLLSVK
jgi:hypothetical protein